MSNVNEPYNIFDEVFMLLIMEIVFSRIFMVYSFCSWDHYCNRKFAPDKHYSKIILTHRVYNKAVKL